MAPSEIQIIIIKVRNDLPRRQLNGHVTFDP